MTTDWFNHAIIYHILIDRFAGYTSQEWEKPVFLGGTLNGIIDRLPYLSDLGVNTLWISPFYQTSAYHGYHITDFYQVDPHFGTEDDLKKLITEAHKQKMKLIADFVPNHCSNQHPYFQDAQHNTDSPYHDWFYFTKWPDHYTCFLSIKELPKLNLTNPETNQHIINAARYWLNLGLDGYRLDHVIGPPHSFWKTFTTEIKHEFPNCILIGEAWMLGIKKTELHTLNIRHKYIKYLRGASSDSLFREYVGELDGVLDFKVQNLIKAYLVDQAITEQMFIKLIQHHYLSFPESYGLPTFLDNHDMDRFLFTCRNNKYLLQKAATLQFSLPQPPIIYYGTETGMTQQKSLWDTKTYGDLLARQPMNWQNPDTNLIKFYKNLITEKKTRS